MNVFGRALLLIFLWVVIFVFFILALWTLPILFAIPVRTSVSLKSQSPLLIDLASNELDIAWLRSSQFVDMYLLSQKPELISNLVADTRQVEVWLTRPKTDVPSQVISRKFFSHGGEFNFDVRFGGNIRKDTAPQPVIIDIRCRDIFDEPLFDGRFTAQADSNFVVANSFQSPDCRAEVSLVNPTSEAVKVFVTFNLPYIAYRVDESSVIERYGLGLPNGRLVSFRNRWLLAQSRSSVMDSEVNFHARYTYPRQLTSDLLLILCFLGSFVLALRLVVLGEAKFTNFYRRLKDGRGIYSGSSKESSDCKASICRLPFFTSGLSQQSQSKVPLILLGFWVMFVMFVIFFLASGAIFVTRTTLRGGGQMVIDPLVEWSGSSGVITGNVLVGGFDHQPKGEFLQRQSNLILDVPRGAYEDAIQYLPMTLSAGSRVDLQVVQTGVPQKLMVILVNPSYHSQVVSNQFKIVSGPKANVSFQVQEYAEYRLIAVLYDRAVRNYSATISAIQSSLVYKYDDARDICDGTVSGVCRFDTRDEAVLITSLCRDKLCLDFYEAKVDFKNASFKLKFWIFASLSATVAAVVFLAVRYFAV
ncbi:hypothetical protein MIR68_010955 [Amoeboaphelidium protococcarum]|nr:hypothetical protein MIR68_010955 [Amoeboaphelidium protococcarum]